jgi:hypothetical protein
MSSCQGRVMTVMVKGSPKMCGNSIWRCKTCGAMGCSREGCTNHRFDGMRCLCCGNVQTTQC